MDTPGQGEGCLVRQELAFFLYKVQVSHGHSRTGLVPSGTQFWYCPGKGGGALQCEERLLQTGSIYLSIYLSLDLSCSVSFSLYLSVSVSKSSSLKCNTFQVLPQFHQGEQPLKVTQTEFLIWYLLAYIPEWDISLIPESLGFLLCSVETGTNIDLDGGTEVI